MSSRINSIPAPHSHGHAHSLRRRSEHNWSWWTCRGGSTWIDSISAKRTQFEGAGVEAIDKIFVGRLGIVGGLDWGRVLTARETSAPSQPAPPKIAPLMAWDEAADAYFWARDTGSGGSSLKRAADAVAEEEELTNAEVIHKPQLVVGEGALRIVDRNRARGFAACRVALVHGDAAVGNQVVDLKPPQAAVVKSDGGEQWGTRFRRARLRDASAKTADEVSKAD
jgi:hypothetical protein